MSQPFISYGTIEQKVLPLHRNIGMEVVLVEQGRLQWSVDGVPVSVMPGDVFFTLPWQVHGSSRAREPGNRITFVQARLDQEYEAPVDAFGFAPDLDIPPAKGRILSRTLCCAVQHAWPATSRLRWLISALVNTLADTDEVLMHQGLFRALLVELEGIVAGQLRGAVRTISESARRVRQLVKTIEDSCEQEWPLSRMLVATGLEKTRLIEVFKQETGDSPHVFLHRSRIAKAELLLRETSMSVTAIGFECGYSTTQLFCRTFKQFTNQTATRARRQLRSSADRPVLVFSEEDEAERLRLARQHDWL